MTPLALAVAVALLLALIGGSVIGLAWGGGSDRKRIGRRLAALSAPRASLAPAAAPSLSLAQAPTGFFAECRALLSRVTGYDANVPNQPAPSWLVFLVALVAARGVTWLVQAIVGPVGWLVMPLAALLIVRGYFLWCVRRWRHALFTQFPDALATIVRAVQVGVALPDSIRRVALEAPEPTAAIFSRIGGEMAIGTPLQDAMAISTASTGLPEYRFFATALILQSRAGGGLAATLDGLAEVIRKRVAVQARGKALAGEARASAAILAVLPVFTMVAQLLINPGYTGLLFTTPNGRAILSAAVGIECMGVLVMRGMIRRALS